LLGPLPVLLVLWLRLGVAAAAAQEQETASGKEEQQTAAEGRPHNR
jgi:hypothetical protein